MTTLNYFKTIHCQTNQINYYPIKDLYSVLDTDRERVEEIKENLRQDKLDSHGDFILDAVSDEEYFDHLDNIHT
jgi:hypothetical protein